MSVGSFSRTAAGNRAYITFCQPTMIIIIDGLIPSFFQLTPVSKQYFLLQLKNLNHPVNYTVKTRD